MFIYILCLRITVSFHYRQLMDVPITPLNESRASDHDYHVKQFACYDKDNFLSLFLNHLPFF